MSAHRFLAVQCIFDSTTAIPKDRVVNTFHFYKGDDTAWTSAQLDGVDAALEHFYRVAPSGSTAALNTFFGVSVAGTWTRKFFDLMDPPPRVPIRVSAGTGFTVGANTMSQETALCLSFEGAKVSGLSQRRRRGRIFFGPLANNTSGVIDQATGRPQRSTNGCLQTLRFAGKAMITDASLTSVGVAWGVYSLVGDSFAAVVDGWVDNAFDTQRRRGLAPTLRDVFP